MPDRRIVATLCMAEVLGMAGFATFPALLPTFVGEWRLTNTDAGWISGIYFAGYMGAVPVLVSLTDRMDPRRIYLWCTGVGVLSALGYAVLANGFWSALLLRCLAGIGLAGTYMPGLKVLSDHIEGPRQSRALSFYTSSFSIGTAVSFVIAGEIAGRLGWRWAFGIAALGSLLALLLAMGAMPRTVTQRSPEVGTKLLDFRPVLRTREAMGYIIAYGAHIWEMFGQRSWIVAFLGFSMSLQPQGTPWVLRATTVAALVNLVGVPASIFGNELALVFGRVRVVTTIMMISVTMSCIIGFLGWLPHATLVVLCLVYGVFVYADSAAITTGAIAAAPAGYRGATMAVHSTFGFACGFMGPLLFGIVLDFGTHGSSVAWGIAFASLGVAAAMGPLALRLLAPTVKRRT